MKTIKMIPIAVAVIIVAACSSSKKMATATVPSTPASTISMLSVKSADGVYVPGDEELVAIQMQYKDVTLNKLKEGHAIYTEGACTNCHGAKNIYEREEAQWKDIIDDMAQRAMLSNGQKDAVYKYVLAIKAMQSK